LREGVTAAIAGPPNAGKSTLLNRLARREAAIVSPYAGTTRDVIEVHLDLDGLPLTLIDTAGIRETEDPVELEGVRRARERAAAADLVLWVVDASAPATTGLPGGQGSVIGRLVPQAKASLAAGPGGGLSPPACDTPTANARAAGTATVNTGTANTGAAGPIHWLVRNKIDLVGEDVRNELKDQSVDKNESKTHFNKPLKSMVKDELTDRNESKITRYKYEFNISASTGAGFDGLLERLARFAADFLAGAESALVTRARHRRALEDTLAALRRALAAPLAAQEDLLAEELRAAAQALGRLTGRVDVEDVLDVIFRDFCVGK
jgi:tRNA modification GTPase